MLEDVGQQSLQWLQNYVEWRALACRRGYKKLQHAAGVLGGVKCGNHVGFFFVISIGVWCRRPSSIGRAADF